MEKEKKSSNGKSIWFASREGGAWLERKTNRLNGAERVSNVNNEVLLRTVSRAGRATLWD